MGEGRFEASPLYLLPVAASLTIGVLCAFLILKTQAKLVVITVFPEAGFGPLLNAVTFVTLMGVCGTVIYLLLKWGMGMLVRLTIGAAFTVTTFTLTLLYLEMIFASLGVAGSGLWTAGLAALLTIMLDVEVFFRMDRLYGVAMLMLGGALGAFLGASIPIWSTILILLLLTFYDAAAVYRGPIGKMVSVGGENLRGISFSFKEVQMGLGDLTFYSMLTAHALIHLGLKECVATILGILLGAYVGLKMLEKRGMFPGLPFSLLLGLAAAYLSRGIF